VGAESETSKGGGRSGNSTIALQVSERVGETAEGSTAAFTGLLKLTLVSEIPLERKKGGTGVVGAVIGRGCLPGLFLTTERSVRYYGGYLSVRKGGGDGGGAIEGVSVEGVNTL